jgi:hypothetical protein
VVLGQVQLTMRPREGARPQFQPQPAERALISEQVAAALVDQVGLAQRLSDTKILLLGEVHFTNEIVGYSVGLLEKVARGRSIVLLLELPQHTQTLIDSFLAEGRESDFQRIWQGNDTLPYQRLISWARQNRSTVRRVVAMDENRRHVVAMRALLAATRNESMTDAILRARRENPDALVAAYGGQFHVMRSGRYLYDVANREPAGARLRRAGVPGGDLRVVLLSGANRFPIADVWVAPGAISAESPLRELAYAAFCSQHVFGVVKARELFDYFINVGPLTEVTEH